MSRIAGAFLVLPEKVEVTLDGGAITVKGPLGSLSRPLSAEVTVERVDNRVQFRPAGRSRLATAMCGTMRALVANMITGVTRGFEKRLALVGVGYRAQAQGDRLSLALGYSHPVVYTLPEGVRADTPTPTEIVIRGTDRQRVGQVAAEVRALRPPEPYKGKGVRYADEQVVLKETKKK